MSRELPFPSAPEVRGNIRRLNRSIHTVFGLLVIISFADFRRV